MIAYSLLVSNNGREANIGNNGRGHFPHRKPPINEVN